MVEELKLAIKVDDDAIEQSLLKQFANAEKMANKVVLTFNNIDLDDKAIEAKFKEMQKMAGKNPIDLSIDKSSIEMLSAISKQLGNIFDIAKGKSIIDSSATVADVNKITNAINGLNSSLSKSNTSALQEEEKQIQKNINSIKKLLDLKYEVKNVNKSSYSGKGNVDWIGIYKSQEEAISSDLSDRKEKLHSSLNLILSEDKNALSSLEEEATKLKTALQSVQEMSNRISSNSSISDLDKNKGSEEWYKSYAEAYKAIDDRLGELNNQYRLTNEELEEYITLQVKAEKIMDRMISNSGGVQGSGAKNKAELKSWIEKSFATDLGLNPEDIYRGLFGNITDALYDGNGISLFDSEGTKRSLREISAEILNYKSIISGFSGSFGANEDAEKLREINSILNYIKNNASEIESTDFSSQIKKASELVDYYSQKLSEGEHTDYYSKSLKDAQDDLQNLISLQERLNATKDKQTNEIINEEQSSSVVEQQNKIQEELKETQKQAEQTSESLSKIGDGNKSNISSGTQIEDSSTSLDKEKKKIENVGDSAEETKKKLDDVIFKPNTEGFDEIISKLDIAKDKIEEISKITKSSVWSESQGEYLESYNIKYKNGTSEIRGESSNKKGSNVLRANEVAYNAKVAEQEAKAVKEVWDKNVKAIQNYMDAVTKLNNLNAKDKGTGKYASQITLQEKNVEELKEKALEARTAITSMINPHDVPLNTWRDYLDVMEKFSQASLGSSESVAKLEDALRKMDFSSLESAGTKFDSQFKNLSIKPDGDHQFLSWTNDLKELNVKIDEYSSKVKYLKENNIVDGEQVKEVKNLRDEIEETINVMTKTPQTKRGWTDIGASKAAEKVANVLKQNTKMSKEARDAIRAYYNELKSGNPSQPIDEILVKVNQLVQKERELGRVGKSFGEIFKEKVIYGGAAQLAGMFGFYDIINIFRDGIDTLKEFDDGLTKISYTMDMTKSQFDGLGKSVLDMSNNLDSSISNAMQVAQIYANMNTSAEEIQKLSEPTLILSNLTGFDASTVADDIQAVTQQFNIAAEDSMHIADVYDQISRNISVDYSKGIESIAEAVQVAGSTADQAGLSFEQLAAIVGKTVEKTRLEGSQVGNGLKTIMTRLSKVGKLSEDVDNETLSQASESLHQIGVEVYNADGSFRQFDTIMGELANKWGVLTDAEKSNISFNIAATRQTNLLSAVLSNFSDSMQLAEDATNANGNALENNQKWVDSFGGHLQSLENTAQTAWINILNSNTLKNGVDVLNSILKIVVELIDKLGILGTVGIGAGAIAGIQNAGKCA